MKSNYLILVIASLFILSLTYFSVWWVVLAILAALAYFAYRTHDNQISSMDGINTKLGMELAEKSQQLDKAMRNEKTMRMSIDGIQKTKIAVLHKISHEVRSPMNGIMGMSSLLGQTPLNEEQNEYLETIRSCGKTMMNTINDILLKDAFQYAMEKNDKTAQEQLDFNLRNCIEDVLSFFTEKDPAKPTELFCRLSDAIPATITGDEGRLRQVLSALVENSLKHTESGEVLVAVTLVGDADHTGRLTLAFDVSDNGSGIAGAQLQEMNFRLSGNELPDFNEEHHGIGLIVAGRLVNSMGGSLQLISWEGVGTSARFNMIAGNPVVPKTRKASVHTMLAGRNAVLLVNSASLGTILEEQLQILKIKTRVAVSGEEALDILSSGEQIDILLVDDRVPLTEGLRSLQKIRKQNPVMPIILMRHPGNERYKSYRGLYTSTLLKPVKQHIFFSKVLAALAPEGHDFTGEKTNEFLLQENFSELYPMHILIAEDNLVNQQFALKILNRLGYTPGVANNGEEVLEMVSHENFHLILMDVEMPGMDGLEATRMIRLCLQSQPVIIAMTANAMQGDREICLKSGMNDYLSKPVGLEELTAILEKWSVQATVS